MEKQRKKSTAVITGRDRISELPDEILHCILRRIQPSRTVDQTATLSRQWPSIWRSYPVAEFNGKINLLTSQYKTIRAFRLNKMIDKDSPDKDAYAKAEADLHRFRDTTIDRYSRDNLLRIEKLKLSILVKNRTLKSSPCVDELLELALKRKAGEVEIVVTKFTSEPGIKLPLIVLFNSTVKILRLSRVMFEKCANLPLSPTALRFLRLDNVFFEEEYGILMNLISSSPHLETLELVCLKKLWRVSNGGNLKNLKIEHDYSELEIVAPGIRPKFKLELTALQLNFLEISIDGGEITSTLLDSLLRACCSRRMILAKTYYGLKYWREFFKRRELHGWRGQLKDVLIERNQRIFISFFWRTTSLDQLIN